MEKIKAVFLEMVNTHLEQAIVDKLDEIVDNLTFLDHLAKRVKKLEFYDKMHRKEHLKK